MRQLTPRGAANAGGRPGRQRARFSPLAIEEVPAARVDRKAQGLLVGRARVRVQTRAEMGCLVGQEAGVLLAADVLRKLLPTRDVTSRVP